MSSFSLHRLFVAIAAHAIFASSSLAVTIETVPIGNPGNLPDTRYGGSYGAVAYSFEMGKYEVTAGQYAEFLNAAAQTDPYSLYDPSMAFNSYGPRILRSGSSGAYTYSVHPGYTNLPVNIVSFTSAARFCNWLHNGQGNGGTEYGAYDTVTFTRQPGAKYFIPTEDEWHKAAYHKNDGPTGNYFDYATSSDIVPANIVIDPDPGNSACYRNTIGNTYHCSVVGEFENSASPYGTFDQSGNVFEWTETAPEPMRRKVRGGGYAHPASFMSAEHDYSGGPEMGVTSNGFGFRVAAIPEPGSITLLICGAAAALLVFSRRRKIAASDR